MNLVICRNSRSQSRARQNLSKKIYRTKGLIMQKRLSKKTGEVSRREFIKTSAAVSVAAMLSGTGKLRAAGSDKIRVGVIGFGGRGSGAAIDCIKSANGVEINALGEL